MVHFEPICEVVNSRAAFVGMGDDNDLVAAVDELCGELINVAFNSSWLGKEEVAYHGNVVRHFGRGGRLRPAEQQSRNALSWRSNCGATHDL